MRRVALFAALVAVLFFVSGKCGAQETSKLTFDEFLELLPPKSCEIGESADPLAPLLPVLFPNSDKVSVTEFKVNSITLWDLLSDKDGTADGSSLELSPFKFDNIHSSKGVTISGDRTRLGSFTFGNWSSNTGVTIRSTSHRLGSFTFRDYSISKPLLPALRPLRQSSLFRTIKLDD